VIPVQIDRFDPEKERRRRPGEITKPARLAGGAPVAHF